MVDAKRWERKQNQTEEDLLCTRLCATLVSSHLVAILSAQSSCARFIDEGMEAHKVNGGSGGEGLHLMLLKENIFFFKKKLFIQCWNIVSRQCYDSFRWTAKGLSHISLGIHSSPNAPPIQAAT